MENMRKQRVLILGANGFIGSHLVDRLAEDNFIVRAFIRAGSPSNDQPAFNPRSNIELFYGDFLNQHDIEEALRDVSHVIHLVSTTTPATSDKEPLVDVTTNVSGSIMLFQKCVENGSIKRIVFASSGGTVYGDNYPDRPFLETDPTEPVSPYGIGKVTIENYLRYFYKTHGQDYTVFRIANPYGGRQHNTKQQGIMPLLIKNIQNNQPVTILGDGTMSRDYLYIYDVVNVIADSLQKDLHYKTYNIGSGKATSVNALVAIVEKVVGRKALVEHKVQPTSFVHTSALDNQRLIEELPTTVFTDLTDGVRETYATYLNQLDS